MCRVGSRGRDGFGDQREEGIFQADASLAGAPVQFVQRTFGDQAPLHKDPNAVGHALGNFENMWVMMMVPPAATRSRSTFLTWRRFRHRGLRAARRE